MSHWNHRITRRKVEGEYVGYVYELREIYYHDDNTVRAWSTDPIAAFGESRDEIVSDLALMSRAAHHPTFDIDAREWLDEHEIVPDYPTERHEPVWVDKPGSGGKKWCGRCHMMQKGGIHEVRLD